MPSRIARASSASVQAPSGPAGVMLAETACIIGSSITTCPPASSIDMSGPSGPCGVWQLPQLIGPRTRYSPRSTGVSAHANEAAEQSAAAHTTDLWNISRPPAPRGLAGSSVVRSGATVASPPDPVNREAGVADPAGHHRPGAQRRRRGRGGAAGAGLLRLPARALPGIGGGDRRLPGAAGLRGAARRVPRAFQPAARRVHAGPARRRRGRGRHAQALFARRLRAQPDVRGAGGARARRRGAGSARG